MNTTLRRWTFPLLVTALLALTPFTRGVTIDSAYLIGTATGLPNSNPSTELDAITDLLNIYNSTPAAQLVAGASYAINAGVNVPPPDLPMVLSDQSGNVNMNVPSGNIDIGVGNSYLMMKASTTWALYYIGGLSGNVTLTNDVILNTNGNPRDISHWIVFDAIVPDPGPNVPDSGTTAGLLGLALLAIAGSRRLFARR